MPRRLAPARKKSSSRRRAPASKTSGSRWSAGVMATSDAMDLKAGVFKSKRPRDIALSLKRSAEASHRRKSSPFRSAMSMLNFEINRGGKNLSAERKRVLNQAKPALRKLFGRPPASS
jgi:hypothetical protein